jgi:hypothetical protein
MVFWISFSFLSRSSSKERKRGKMGGGSLRFLFVSIAFVVRVMVREGKE